MDRRGEVPEALLRLAALQCSVVTRSRPWASGAACDLPYERDVSYIELVSSSSSTAASDMTERAGSAT